MDKPFLNMDGTKSPLRSPARSPALSPARSPALSPNRSPSKSPNISPGRASPKYGSPPHARHRSASIPVTPEALKGVRNRFLNAPGGLYPLGESNRDSSVNLLAVDVTSRERLPRSAPELTVDEASSGSISPWNDNPSEYTTSLAYTVQRPQVEVLSRRFSETLTVGNDHTYRSRRRRKSLSPHHSRSLSFRALKRSGQFTWDEFRPRGNSVPCADPLQPRSRRASQQYPGRDRSVSPRPSLPQETDEYYMLRQFCITSKGDVVNKGDLYRHRSKSNNSVASTASSMTGGTGGGASTATSCSSGNPNPTPPKKVLMLGTVGVGKTSLVTQFMSSEYMNAYDGSLEEDTEKNISILLDGEEYEISFIDPPIMSETPGDDQIEADAYIVVYSITDRGSFEKAVDSLFKLREKGCTMNKAVILVGNKSDLVRSRAISIDEAKSVACSYECKFTETSAVINHQVDELLVGIVTQIRLKQQQQLERTAFASSATGGGREKRHSLRKRMSLGGSSRKARGIFGKLLGKGKIKSQSCGNLHVL